MFTGECCILYFRYSLFTISPFIIHSFIHLLSSNIYFIIVINLIIESFVSSISTESEVRHCCTLVLYITVFIILSYYCVIFDLFDRHCEYRTIVPLDTTHCHSGYNRNYLSTPMNNHQLVRYTYIP